MIAVIEFYDSHQLWLSAFSCQLSAVSCQLLFIVEDRGYFSNKITLGIALIISKWQICNDIKKLL